MNSLLLLCSGVLLLCVFSYKFLSRFGVPMLLVFIGLGLFFGVGGPIKIDFDDFVMAKEVCSFALIFIIFFGGFGTKISAARGVIGHAVTLATVGVFLTAAGVGAFCYFVLGFEFQSAFLVGAVLSSTDAASVFSILRSHNLNLSEKTAPLLEMESGSNDPMAYVLTTVALSMGSVNIPLLLFRQIVFGVLIGFGMAYVTRQILRRVRFNDRTFTMAFLLGIMLFTYAVSEGFGGNGYVTAYIFGIVVGNGSFEYKKEIVHFFDGVTAIMQMLIFFLLGLLVNPGKALTYFWPAVAVMVVLTLIVRPVAIWILSTLFRASNRQKLLVSWAGLRGAASVVFATLAVVENEALGFPAFDIAFIVVLISIALQGATLPVLSRRLNMIEAGSVLKTFNDYSEEEDIDFITFEIDGKHEWAGKRIREIQLMPSVLLVLIIRGEEEIIPEGNTLLEVGDRAVLCGSSFTENKDQLRLSEITVDAQSEYKDKMLREIGGEERTLIVMIKRGDTTKIPDGTSTVREGDVLVLLER